MLGIPRGTWPPRFPFPPSGDAPGVNRIGPEGFKLSRDKLFVEKLIDVAGLYLNPPDKAVVLCVDEKIQTQAWTVPNRVCR
jgi:hypothetical protein